MYVNKEYQWINK